MNVTIYSTESPNRFVVRTEQFYMHVENRLSSQPFEEAIRKGLEHIEATNATLPEGHEIRPRMMFADDVHGGGYDFYVDYLFDSGEPDSVEESWPDGAWSDGQWYRVHVMPRKVDRGSDWYDPDRDNFYRSLKELLGGEEAEQ